MNTITNFRSYRCRIRKPNQPPAEQESLDSFIQLKAPNAEEAMRLAAITMACAVIDAVRLEG